MKWKEQEYYEFAPVPALRFGRPWANEICQAPELCWIQLLLSIMHKKWQYFRFPNRTPPSPTHTGTHTLHTPINLPFIWIFGCKWISNDILRLYIIILLLYCFCSATCHQSSFVDCTTTSSSSLFVGFVHQRNYVHAMMITIIIIIWIHI